MWRQRGAECPGCRENRPPVFRLEQARRAEDHKKAAAAQEDGRLSDEIVAITDGNIRVEQDGCIRAGTTTEDLAGLDPAFDKDGSVTAGTSSEYADANSLTKLARIKSIAVSGCAPEIMGIGPVGATNKALERAGLDIGDIDIIELNEAFSSQALAVMREIEMDMAKVNLDGGAIALGHPLGATGARITGKAAALLKREGKELALATQCIGGGQGIATILEAC